jgi:uncharacterized protein
MRIDGFGIGGLTDSIGQSSVDRKMKTTAEIWVIESIEKPSRELNCNTIFRVRFVWSQRKANSNLKKHGVSFEEASSAFGDPLAAYYPDTLHKDRFILIGYSKQRRLLYVVHAEVHRDAIRIISARRATKHEKTHYEND